MQDIIIKKLLLQKKHGRHKYLFGIKLYEIEKIGINNFIYIYLKFNKLKEDREKLKYFRLDSKYEDILENNNNKIVIEFDSSYKKESFYIIKELQDKINKFQFIYKINNTKNKEIENELFKKIKDRFNLTYYIKSKYNKNDILWIEKNKNIFINKDIYLSLDYITKQEEVKNENIFEIIQILKNNNAHINTDFIRLESAFKKIYVLGPKELHLDLSEFCNTNCIFCRTNGPGFLTQRDSKENRYKVLYDANKYINLFKKMEKSQVETLAIGITGEPFIHPEIGKILKGLKYINFSIGFLTNGYKLLKNIELILENKNIKHFYLNISSGNLKSFDITRPGDNFQNFLNVWKAIKLIREKRPDIIVRGLYIIIPQNICGINDFIELAIKNNLSEIELKRVVPYEFSNEKFNFDEKKVNEIISIIKSNKQKFKINNIGLNENFDYIINDLKNALKTIQYPEDEKIDKSKLKPVTNNCYNPYFYISINRNTSYSCGKFLGKIGKLTNFDLYEGLFEEKNVKNIIKGAENLKDFLGNDKRRTGCSRCHHIDVNNMVKNYLDIKKLCIKGKNVVYQN